MNDQQISLSVDGEEFEMTHLIPSPLRIKKNIITPIEINNKTVGCIIFDINAPPFKGDTIDLSVRLCQYFIDEGIKEIQVDTLIEI